MIIAEEPYTMLIPHHMNDGDIVLNVRLRGLSRRQATQLKDMPYDLAEAFILDAGSGGRLAGITDQRTADDEDINAIVALILRLSGMAGDASDREATFRS